MSLESLLSFFFFFNDTATTEIYTLSLHDALPIFAFGTAWYALADLAGAKAGQKLLVHSAAGGVGMAAVDRKSTRLNSSHVRISYAVFCLKKKKQIKTDIEPRALQLDGEEWGQRRA